MSSTYVGIICLLVGIFLLPFGISYFKETWEEFKELTCKKKIIIFFLEIIDMSISTWVLFISIVLILFGIVLIVLV